MEQRATEGRGWERGKDEIEIGILSCKVRQFVSEIKGRWSLLSNLPYLPASRPFLGAE